MIVAVTVGRNEFEPFAIREVLRLSRASALVPCGLKGLLCWLEEVNVAPDVCRLHTTTAFHFLIAVKFDQLQLQIDVQADQTRQRFQTELS